MLLIPGELLAWAFLTKTFISPTFKGESSNFSTGGCVRLGSLRRLNGVSVSGSVYFFRRCAYICAGYIKDPVFLSLKQFLGEFKLFFSKLHLAFRFVFFGFFFFGFFFFCRRFLAFSALAMTRIFSLISDNCFFTNSRSFGIYLSRFLRSLYSNLSRPFSRCLLLAVGMFFFSFLDIFSSKMLKANCMNSFSERI